MISRISGDPYLVRFVFLLPSAAPQSPVCSQSPLSTATFLVTDFFKEVFLSQHYPQDQSIKSIYYSCPLYFGDYLINVCLSHSILSSLKAKLRAIFSHHNGSKT